ncbi:MAG: SRPBCC family protein, partial [Proteobacteria bacterium]|nr:SRPBCC family protein [Pseudomonadota bacterium]
DPQACFSAFTDPSTLVGWVPGLRRAQVIAKGPRGLPSEIHFEYASSLVYTLAYNYDLEAREVRWEAKLGRRDGVSGSVKFEPFDEGTRVTYSLRHGDGRDPKDREAGEADVMVDAFVAWMKSVNQRA